MDETIIRERVLAEARRARERAFAPYSHFHVGAAVMLSDGSVVVGCNVENASYGLSVCAERVALWSAVAQGRRDFVAMGVFVPNGTPCGACRQVMSELCPPNMPVWVENGDGSVRRFTVAELLPAAFRREDLGGEID